MAVSGLVIDEDERLPLILGFQKVADATNQLTRFVEYGKGIKVFDTDGREYIEATSSFYVTALGYQNDELIDAIEKQYRELPFFVSALNRTSKSSLDLAERLVDILPVDNAHILFASTGSEAIDFLIKMLRFGAVARGVPQRRTIIGRHGSYHGGTLASASLTGGHHEDFGLPIEGFRHVAQPDFHGDREPGQTSAEYTESLSIELRKLIEREPEDSVAAFFAEPISFSAGFKVPPSEYFPVISSVLDEYSIDFVADEVVTGFGRTGAPFGSDTFALKPKHVTVAKAITSAIFHCRRSQLANSFTAIWKSVRSGSVFSRMLAHFRHTQLARLPR
jgi:4-aminobutyrate--pyruvate transaminase